MIDLRSDTVTRPTPAMRQAMLRAEVGDDVYGEDPTVRRLEERVAELFGHEDALFTPTGSMANLLAVSLLVERGQEVLCHEQAHIVRAELGAHAAISGITTRTWSGSALPLDSVADLIAPDLGPFFVATRAVSVENTHNFRGGEVIGLAPLQRLRRLADERGVGVHVDGARIWNAHVASGTPLVEYGAIADVMSVCLSKGLGAPVGSLLMGSADAMVEARVRRKRVGGGMRQVGMLAAAGLFALEHHVDRMAEDHEHARLIAEACGVDPKSVATNIVLIEVHDAARVVAQARDAGVALGAVGTTTVRLLTHLDISRADAEKAAKILSKLV